MNNLFDKIFYINLEHRTDRKQLCEDFFNKNNIKAERFEAEKNSNPTVGCAFSHYKLFLKAKELNLKNVLILEDDFYFPNFDIAYIQDAYSQLPADWDIFYLGYNPTEKLQPFSNNLFKVNGAWCLHAYCVNSRFYDVFLNNFRINVPVDVVVKELQKKYKMYGLRENYCLQRNNYSDIDKKFNFNGDIIQEDMKIFG